MKRHATVFCSLLAGMAALVRLPAAAAQPDYYAPWPDAKKKEVVPQKTEKAAPVQPATSQTPAGSTTNSVNHPVASSSQTSVPAGLDTKMALRPPKLPKNQIAISGDYLLGQGNVTVPAGYALAGAGITTGGTAPSANRNSTYYGGTLSYSFGQAWFLDLGYSTGESHGNLPFVLSGVPFNTSFKIQDDWYQAYLRYTFPKLRGKKLSAYLRVGVSDVQAKLHANGPTGNILNLGVYDELDKTSDLLGNLGFGVGYSFRPRGRFRLGLQAEAEGFFGSRSQAITETLFSPRNPSGVSYLKDINNTIYGVVARATIRGEYRLGQSGLFKTFGEGGFQLRDTQIKYPGVGNRNELLWGPYVKLGVSYSF